MPPSQSLVTGKMKPIVSCYRLGQSSVVHRLQDIDSIKAILKTLEQHSRHYEVLRVDR